MDNILVPSMSLQHTRLILLALVIIAICIVIVLFVIFNREKDSTEKLEPTQNIDNIFDAPPQHTYEPAPIPLPVNDLRLSDEDMKNATLITLEKNIIEKLRNKIIKLEIPSISSNFRLYGNLTHEGRILLFDHTGACVAEFKRNNGFLHSNISGKTFQHRFPLRSKSYHFVIENYKIFLNGLELGELHGQQDVQYIKVNDKEIQDIQLMEIDPNISMFEIGEKSIF